MIDLRQLVEKLYRDAGCSEAEIAERMQFTPEEKAAKRAADYHYQQKMRLLQKTVEAWRERRDTTTIQRLFFTHQILEEMARVQFDLNDVAGIRVTIGNRTDDTSACKPLTHRVYTFDEALKEMPLPCKKMPGETYCRCFWSIVFKDEL